jgi:predicted permease
MGDLRYAVRQLLRSPGFTFVAVATLALCIGANTAIFSVINAILLKPYPWPGSERLVYANNSYPVMGLIDAGVSIPDYLDRHDGVTSFEDSALFSYQSLNLDGDGRPERLSALGVTPSLFTTLQSPAALGRTFTADDAKPGAPATVVLSDALWHSRFGGDPAVVGREIRLDDRPVTVVGVMPAGFYFPNASIQAWTAYAFTPLDRSDAERGHEHAGMIARLKPGATAAAAQREIDLIQARNAARLPEKAYFWKASGFTGRVSGFLEHNVEDVRTMLLVIQAGVAAALLIGCANVAGLLLARSVGRQKELAIRTALGATRGRLLRLLMIEGGVLFAAGAAAGLLVAAWGLTALRALGLAHLPRGFDVRLDPAVFTFTLGCAVVTGLLFGGLPAWAASRHNPSASLKEAGRGSAGRRTQRLRSILVVTEVALAVMLVSTAGLLVKSFVRMQRVDPGFRPGGVVVGQVALPSGRYDTPAKITAFDQAVQGRLAAVPGITAAGSTSFLPFSDTYDAGSYTSPDIKLAPDEAEPHALIRSADPGYLKALGLTLQQGRWFDETDTAAAAPVVVIDRLLVDRYWKGENPIGKRISRRRGDQKVLWTVIGVVAAVKTSSLAEHSRKESIYFPMTQAPEPDFMFVLRTTGNPAILAPALRAAVAAVDPVQPLFNVSTMEEKMADAAEPQRAPVVLLSAFGGIAIVLAMLGIYGVLAYSVAQRTPEFGIRMALGSSPGQIAALVLRAGAALIGLGAAAGLAGYIVLSRLVASLLFDTAALDPATLASAPLLLALVALAASLLPALRATRIQPIVALRGE